VKRFNKIFIPVIILLISGCVIFSYCLIKRNSPESGLYGYKIVNTFAHDPNAFTQGLVWDDGYLYEGTGLPGHSTLRKVEPETGKVLQSINLPAEYFGEGITIFNDKIIQLTYMSKVGFVYDKKTFQKLHEFNYPKQGWGITHDGKRLITSDGTPTLYFLDPQTFEVISSVDVYYNNNLLWDINELEFVDGWIYANIWKTDRIAIIEPKTGQVIALVDLTGLLAGPDRPRNVDVLNGIAYDAENHRLFVTGKFWPKLFEIKLVPKK
jgi:glutamine cyclotransferase